MYSQSPLAGSYQQPLSPQLPILLITELPLDCGEMDLMQLTQPFGKIKNIEIKSALRPTGKIMYGMVEYHTPESAENAKNNLNGVRYSNKILRTELTTKAALLQPQATKPATQSFYQPNVNIKGMRSAQVHISYLSKQMNFVITAEFLKTVFNHFGPVVEISLKKTCVDPEMSVQNGYGFVHYPLSKEGITAALNAVNSLHQVTINQITYDCSISNQLNQILANIEKARARRGPNGTGGYYSNEDQLIDSLYPDIPMLSTPTPPMTSPSLPYASPTTTSTNITSPILSTQAIPMTRSNSGNINHKMNTSAAEFYPSGVPGMNMNMNNAGYSHGQGHPGNNNPNNMSRATKYFSQSYGSNNGMGLSSGSTSGQNSASNSVTNTPSATPTSKYNDVPLAPGLPGISPSFAYGGLPAVLNPNYSMDGLNSDVDETTNFGRPMTMNNTTPTMGYRVPYGASSPHTAAAAAHHSNLNHHPLSHITSSPLSGNTSSFFTKHHNNNNNNNNNGGNSGGSGSMSGKYSPATNNYHHGLGMTSYGYGAGNPVPLNSSSSDSFNSGAAAAAGLSNALHLTGLNSPPPPPPALTLENESPRLPFGVSTSSASSSLSSSHSSKNTFHSLLVMKSQTQTNPVTSTPATTTSNTSMLTDLLSMSTASSTPNTFASGNTTVDTSADDLSLGGSGLGGSGVGGGSGFFTGLQLGHTANTLSINAGLRKEDRWGQTSSSSTGGGSGHSTPPTNHTTNTNNTTISTNSTSAPSSMNSSSLYSFWGQPSPTSTGGIAMIAPEDPPGLLIRSNSALDAAILPDDNNHHGNNAHTNHLLSPHHHSLNHSIDVSSSISKSTSNDATTMHTLYNPHFMYQSKGSSNTTGGGGMTSTAMKMMIPTQTASIDDLITDDASPKLIPHHHHQQQQHHRDIPFASTIQSLERLTMSSEST